MKTRFSVTIAIGLFAGVSPAHAATPITGKYLTDGGNAVVQIQPCGGTLCGKIVRIVKATQGTHTATGTVILSDLVESGDQWKGTIHNPENGKSYNAKVKLNPDRSLKIQVCLGPICKGPTWQPTS